MTVNTITGNDYTLYSTTDAASASSSGGGTPTVFVSGRYYVPSGLSSGARLTTSGSLYALPFYVGATTSITRIGAEVTAVGAAGSFVRLGIYAGQGAPSGAPVLDAGTIAGDSATAQEITVAHTLAAGFYWLCAKAESAGTFPTLRAFTGTSSSVGGSTLATATGAGMTGYLASGVAAGPLGAFPGTFLSLALVPAVALKIA